MVAKMKFDKIIYILTAAGAGFLGGSLADQTRAEAARPDVVRASRFELVNSAGAVAASWEIDSHNNPYLRFLGNGKYPF